MPHFLQKYNAGSCGNLDYHHGIVKRRDEAEGGMASSMTEHQRDSAGLRLPTGRGMLAACRAWA